jgi:signal peptidase I
VHKKWSRLELSELNSDSELSSEEKIRRNYKNNFFQVMDEQNINNPEAGEETYYGVGSFIWEVVKVFLWALIIIIPIRVFLFQPFFVQGASMEPNFEDGDYLIINELGYKQSDFNIGGLHIFTAGSFKDLKRYDVAVFRYPVNPQQFFIKRVIGLPGEEIKVKDGKVIVYNVQNPDGFTLNEDKYLDARLFTTGDLDLKLGQDQYFVLGDNRKASYDSRVWGAVPKSDIIGKVLIRAWPFSKAEIL